MDQNIYAAPQATLIEVSKKEQALASRWERLWASLIDSITMMLIIMPTMIFTGGLDVLSGESQPSFSYNLAMGALGLIAFLLINGFILTKYGQTLGKKIMGIKIVDLDGDLPNWSLHLIKRYAVYFAPGQIPVIGQFVSIINVLFIFGNEKRCVHDYVAGTMVVKSRGNSRLPPTHVEFDKTDDVSENIRRYKEAQRNALDRTQQNESKK